MVRISLTEIGEKLGREWDCGFISRLLLEWHGLPREQMSQMQKCLESAALSLSMGRRAYPHAHNELDQALDCACDMMSKIHLPGFERRCEEAGREQVARLALYALARFEQNPSAYARILDAGIIPQNILGSDADLDNVWDTAEGMLSTIR